MGRVERRVADVYLHDSLDKIEDKLELLETMVVSMVLVSTWQVSYDLLRAWSTKKGETTPSETAGFALAIVLWIFEAALIFKYAVNTHSMVLGEEHRKRRLSALPQPRLKERLRFTTKRFRPGAPYWQFVVWGRQFGLWVCTVIPDSTVAPVPSNVTIVSSEAPQSWSVYFAAGIAVAVFAGAWALHVRAHPYVFAFQNFVESGLFFSSIVVVVGATLYTALKECCDETVGDMLALDIGLLVLLVGSIALATCQLSWNYRKQQRKLVRALSRQVSQQLSRAISWSRDGHSSDGDDASARTASRGSSGDGQATRHHGVQTMGAIDEEPSVEGAAGAGAVGCSTRAAGRSSVVGAVFGGGVARAAMRGSLRGSTDALARIQKARGATAPPTSAPPPTTPRGWARRSLGIVADRLTGRRMDPGGGVLIFPARVSIGDVSVMIRSRSRGTATSDGTSRRTTSMGVGAWGRSRRSEQDASYPPPDAPGDGDSAAQLGELGFDEAALRRAAQQAKPPPPPPPRGASFLDMIAPCEPCVGLPDYCGDDSRPGATTISTAASGGGAAAVGGSGSCPGAGMGAAGVPPRTQSFQQRRLNERMHRARRHRAAAASGSIRAQNALRTVPVGAEVSTRAAAGKPASARRTSSSSHSSEGEAATKVNPSTPTAAVPPLQLGRDGSQVAMSSIPLDPSSASPRLTAQASGALVSQPAAPHTSRTAANGSAGAPAASGDEAATGAPTSAGGGGAHAGGPGAQPDAGLPGSGSCLSPEASAAADDSQSSPTGAEGDPIPLMLPSSAGLFRALIEPSASAATPAAAAAALAAAVEAVAERPPPVARRGSSVRGCLQRMSSRRADCNEGGGVAAARRLWQQREQQQQASGAQAPPPPRRRHPRAPPPAA